MIIRIAGEGQYRFPSAQFDDLDEADNRVVGAVERGDNSSFTSALATLLDMVRTKGQRVPDDDLVESEVVLPYPDLTLEEARHVFIGDGLVSR